MQANRHISAPEPNTPFTGLEIASGDFDHFLIHVSMILCFIAGRFSAGAINPKPKPYKISPEYGPTFLLGSALLLVASILADWDPEDRGMYFLAAASNGLSNGLSSIYSANLIRTSHLTGASTDIGLILGQMARGHYDNYWKLIVLLLLAFFFAAGSAVSHSAIQAFASLALVFNACFFFAISLGCIAYVHHVNPVTWYEAATGSWDWQTVLHHLRVSGDPEFEWKHQGDNFLLTKFSEMDADGSGYIDQEELKQALKKAGIAVSDTVVSKLMAIADVDGNGVISEKEWEILVKQCYVHVTEENTKRD